MSGGKGAAYQRFKPLEGDITDDLINAENQEFKHRAEDRLIADRTKADVDAQLKADKEKAEAKKKDLEGLYIGNSGFKSHDEALIEILQGEGGIFDQYSNLLDELDKTPNNTQLLAKQITLKKSVENLRGLKDGMVARAQMLQKGLADGSMSPSLNKGLAENYDALIKDFKYNYKIKDNGEIVIENQGYDPDKDGILNELSVQDVWDPEKMKLQGYFDAKKWVQSTKDELGKHEKTTDNGVTSHKLVGFDPTKIDALREKVTALFGEDLATMTPEAKSYINDSLGGNYKEMTEKTFDNVKEAMIRDTKYAYDSIDNKNVTLPRTTGSGSGNDDGPKGIVPVEDIKSPDGKTTIKRFTLNEPYVIKGTNDSARPSTIHEIRYNPVIDKVILVGEEYRGSETTKNKGTATSSGTRAFSPSGTTTPTTSNTPQQGDTSKKEEDWQPFEITDKAKITNILAKVMGAGSYDEIIKQLRGPKKEDDKQSNKPTYPEWKKENPKGTFSEWKNI